jgi:hypothetical protein
MLRRVLSLACVSALAAGPVPAWHNPVHQMITAAALRSLPAGLFAFWGAEGDRMAAEYSLYPDEYHNAPPARQAEMRPFCEVNGRRIHNVTWNRRQDLESLDYLRRNIAAAVRAGDARSAARYAGTLAHMVEDSTCPAHAMTPWDSPLELIRDLLAPPADKRAVRLHTVIEVGSPAVDLGGRAPRRLANEALLDAVYEGVRANRAVLLEVARAAYAGDEKGMDPARRNASRMGAELLADAIFSAQSEGR